MKRDTDKSGRHYADFKRVVWHNGFDLILKDILLHAKTGYSMDCGDDILRRIFPIVLILSADYEEQ